jgi:hypothetical protein
MKIEKTNYFFFKKNQLKGQKKKNYSFTHLFFFFT